MALEFFREQKIPFWEMKNANALIGNAANSNSKFCLTKAAEVYLVYLPEGGHAELDLSGGSGTFTVQWFNPREGGELRPATPAGIRGGGAHTLIAPDQNDWLALVRKP